MTAAVPVLDEAEVLVSIDTQRPGRLRAENLGEILTPIRQTLRDLDVRLERRAHRPSWDIRGMHQDGQSLRLILSPDYGRRRRGTMEPTAAALISGLQALHQVPELPASFDAAGVERIRKLAAVQDVTAVHLEIARERRAIVDDETSANAAAATSVAQHSFGSAHGVLDTMSARRKFRCQVFDRATRRSVTVTASDDDIEAKLRLAFGTDVVLWGELTRNAVGQPLGLVAHELYLRGWTSPRPSAGDLLGILVLPPGRTSVDIRDEAWHAS